MPASARPAPRRARTFAAASTAAAALAVAGASAHAASPTTFQVAGTTPAATTPADVPPVIQGISFKTKYVTGTRTPKSHSYFSKLKITTGVLDGDLVKVSCAGKGCDHMKTKRFTISGGATSINLLSAVKGYEFSNGAEVRVKTARSGTRSRIFRFKFSTKP